MKVKAGGPLRTLAAGFTLIELVITVVIVGVLAAIALPTYSQYVERGRRAEAKAALNGAAQMLERFYTQTNSYTVALAALGVSATTESGRHAIVVSPGATGDIATSFLITASPVGWADAHCGNLTLDSAGRRGRSAAGWSVEDCWQR
ncbi:type IV pilin protein [Niveibacterium microcysteis]|uniref:Type IV pilin protein n=1 Tax=Niveibacterium microcysteis TaxID=2811415 RepID=A0ABX7M823_9RHOO|nr:type IV pilin protein [Niveibacterium microcysteis]QSI75632.1 type IV pilin protein [Niveibacterium microcysteis]